MQIYRRLLLCLLIQPLTVWAVDLQPNDIVAPLPDKNHAMISYINTDNTTYYKNGSIVSVYLMVALMLVRKRQSCV